MSARKLVGRYRDQLRGALVRRTAPIKIQMGQIRPPGGQRMRACGEISWRVAHPIVRGSQVVGDVELHGGS
jgi:hypothetical protein